MNEKKWKEKGWLNYTLLYKDRMGESKEETFHVLFFGKDDKQSLMETLEKSILLHFKKKIFCMCGIRARKLIRTEIDMHTFVYTVYCNKKEKEEGVQKE